ncbi:MerR family transcriptional regulator, partial [Mammaliicoccus sciuri]|uniref:MerR family transcriptional regulator n=1 Tax=Mammaliicoccus sciuri TaxID=1296 RepID=UPI000FEFC1F9
MRIDDVSKSLNITKSQIRYYEKVGLLKIPRDANQYHVLKYPLNLSGIYTISTY